MNGKRASRDRSFRKVAAGSVECKNIVKVLIKMNCDPLSFWALFGRQLARNFVTALQVCHNLTATI
jgi:hypothetical protein